jgi:hypothetical protein
MRPVQALPGAGTPGALFECSRGRLAPVSLSTGLGLPLSYNERGKLLPGTFGACASTGESQREKLQDPDFIRAFAETVILVRPGKQLLARHDLVFDKFAGGGWHLLRRCLTLRGARALAGLAITSPRNVISSFGRSLRDLAATTPDQFYWLRSSWRIACPWQTIRYHAPKRQLIRGDWKDNLPRLRLGAFVRESIQTSSGSHGLSGEDRNYLRISYFAQQHNMLLRHNPIKGVRTMMRLPTLLAFS